MQRVGNRLATSALALLLAGSLTFGVSSALAQVPGPCDYNPPTVLGYCSSEQECENRCIGSGGIDGICSENCCFCAI